MNSDRPRVLMLSKACIVGIYQRKLEEIARQNVDLLVLVPPFWRDERGITPLERAYTSGYRLETIDMRFNGNFHLHYYQELKDRIRAFRPQIVHIDEEPYNVAAWQALFHARRIKAKTLFFTWQNIARRYPLPFRLGERYVLRNVDYAIAGTQSAANVWREKGFIKPISVIPQFGTDTSLFKPLENRPTRPFTMGYVGRLIEEKGVHLLIDAVSALQGEWALHILGGGPMLDTLRERVRQHGIEHKVYFDGQVPSMQVPEYFHKLDVLALPSLTRTNWKEQFGRVITEAMASGVVVVGSDSGAIPDVIGEAGVIVPEGDATALANVLAQLQSDRALVAHLSLMGLDRVESHFTHQQVAAETVQVYREMLS